ncbi:hypothetical protein [Chitinophaga sp.]|uniref:hypothetical protein n=1 Tax=Chitinophaga sp. TaxID=1869181 RepID=UPI0031D4EFAA
MKKTITFCTLLLVALAACKKDTPAAVDYFLTTAYFVANTNTITYSDTSKNTFVTYNATGSRSYAITLGSAFRAISDSLQPQLSVGQEIKMPFFRYYGPYGDHGTETQDDDIAPGSGSTIVITITRVGNRDFDATFSGKVWSAKEPDTLFIKDGQLKQVKLPNN